MSERFVRLGDFVDLLTGFPFKSAEYTEGEKNPKLLRGDNIVQGTTRWANAKRWPAAGASEFQQYELAAGDVVLAMDRPWIEAGLKFAQVSETDLPALLVQRVSRMRALPGLHSRFLHYVIASKRFTDYVQSVQTGTAVPHISAQQIKDYGFRMPCDDEQTSIASILGALDDKINLNRRMNESLEAIARAMFRDWFVDFGPTRAKIEGRAPYLVPELWDLFPMVLDDGPKPSGWQHWSLGELASHHRTTVSPAAYPKRIFEHYSIPAYDAGMAPSLDAGASIRSNKTTVATDAVLLSKLNPNIPRAWIPNPPDDRQQIASTEFLAFTPKSPASRSLLYCLFRDSDFRREMEAMVTGTSKSHQRVSPKALIKRQVLHGVASMFDRFDERAAPLLSRVLSNRAEARTLAQTRDLLLPKLMSGEIRMREAEKAVEAVI